MISNIFDALLLYYGCVLGLSAVTGVRDTLRSGPSASTSPAAVAAASGSSSTAAGASGTTSGGAASSSRWSRNAAAFRTGLFGYSVDLARTMGWGAGFGAVIGFLAGRDFYRGGRRGVGIAARWTATRYQAYRARRAAAPDSIDPEPTPRSVDPTAADDAEAPAPIPVAGPSPEPTAAPPTAPPPSPPPAAAAAPPAPPIAAPPVADLVDAAPTTTAGPASVPPVVVVPAVAAGPGERRLFIVKDTPVRKEPSMAAGDITGIETLMVWTKNASGTAEMEAADAGCTARDAAASVDFCQETAARIEREMRDLEAAITVMMALGIDGHTIAAYQRQLETGHVYHQAAVRVAELSQLLSGAAAFAQTAANSYQEQAEAALATVKRQQLPHLEAAQATGHSSAHGSVYGAADTRSGAHPDPALPRA